METGGSSLGDAVLATEADAIIAADSDGVIRFWNAGAERIFGYSSSEALGQSLDIIIPERLRDRVTRWAGAQRQRSRDAQGRVAPFAGVHDHSSARRAWQDEWHGSHPARRDGALRGIAEAKAEGCALVSARGAYLIMFAVSS